uniref:hypothetical protein n=1 Tax=Streptomyces sp. WAC05458 TaxID=2487412 RepID=UPI0021AF7FB7|nr:hypothetical protein [Streptomyces sp. WAC05458]
MHRPAAFAALLGLTRAASAIGDFWVQNDFRARVKGASDDAPVTYEGPATKEKTTHGTADGRKACLHHCVTYTATQAIVAGFGARALGIRVHPGAAAATLALSFGTHYIADRRVPGHGDLRELHQVHGRLFMCGPELRGPTGSPPEPLRASQVPDQLVCFGDQHFGCRALGGWGRQNRRRSRDRQVRRSRTSSCSGDAGLPKRAGQVLYLGKRP